SDDVPAGQVIRTEPGAGGGVAATDQVVVVISQGPGLLVVPDLVGLPSVEAYANLTDLGLTWVEVVEASDTVVAGGVIRTEPGAGEQVDVGGEVVVVISGGSGGVTTTDTTVPETGPPDEDTETTTG
ncbi:MAG: PASTA domain-containing protein, partial [bacterium]|nr:PASTA domain-containing protein [bacterium]